VNAWLIEQNDAYRTILFSETTRCNLTLAATFTSDMFCKHERHEIIFIISCLSCTHTKRHEYFSCILKIHEKDRNNFSCVLIVAAKLKIKKKKSVEELYETAVERDLVKQMVCAHVLGPLNWLFI
jgi:hypothetical protein